MWGKDCQYVDQVKRIWWWIDILLTLCWIIEDNLWEWGKCWHCIDKRWGLINKSSTKPPQILCPASLQEHPVFGKSSIPRLREITGTRTLWIKLLLSPAISLTHRVRLQVWLEHLPLAVVDALGLLEEPRHKVREEGIEVDGRHVEHARRDLFPQLNDGFISTVSLRS